MSCRGRERRGIRAKAGPDVVGCPCRTEAAIFCLFPAQGSRKKDCIYFFGGRFSCGWVSLFGPSAGCGAGDARLCWRRLRPEAPPARAEQKCAAGLEVLPRSRRVKAGRTRGEGREVSRREIAEKQNAIIIHLFPPSFLRALRCIAGEKTFLSPFKDIVSWELWAGSYPGLISV